MRRRASDCAEEAGCMACWLTEPGPALLAAFAPPSSPLPRLCCCRRRQPARLHDAPRPRHHNLRGRHRARGGGGGAPSQASHCCLSLARNCGACWPATDGCCLIRVCALGLLARARRPLPACSPLPCPFFPLPCLPCPACSDTLAFMFETYYTPRLTPQAVSAPNIGEAARLAWLAAYQCSSVSNLALPTCGQPACCPPACRACRPQLLPVLGGPEEPLRPWMDSRESSCGASSSSSGCQWRQRARCGRRPAAASGWQWGAGPGSCGAVHMSCRGAAAQTYL